MEDVARRFASDPVLALFAEYCRLKGLGLRRQALQVMDKFVDELSADSNVASRFEVVNRLFEIEHETDIHQLLPHLLVTKVMKPTCEARIAESSEDPRPYRWLGFQDNWRRALELDPADVISRSRWSSACLRDLDYALHEPPLGVLSSIGDIAENVMTLDQLSKEPGGPTNWPGSGLRRLAIIYLDYARSGERIGFEQWAARRGWPSS